MDEQRLESFERWAVEHGTSDVSALDRRKVAADLYALGGEQLGEEHIEALAARYKAGLQGAHRILAVRKVGAELREWLSTGTAPAAGPRGAAGAPKGAATSGGSFGAHPAAKSVGPRPGRVSLQWAKPVAPPASAAPAAEARPSAGAPRSPTGSGEARPEPRAKLSVHSTRPSAHPVASALVEGALATSSADSFMRLAAPGSSALAPPALPNLEVDRPGGVAARARRADLELGFAEEGLGGDRGDAFDDDPAPPPGKHVRSTLRSAHPASPSAAPGAGASARPPAASPLPFIAPRASGSPLPFAAPAARHASATPAPDPTYAAPASEPPESAGAPSKPASEGSRRPSAHPSSAAPRSASVRPPSLSPASSLRTSVRPPGSASLFPPSPEPEEAPSRTWLYVVSGVIAVALLVALVVGLSSKSGPSTQPVLGTFPSEHLSLSFRAPGLWLHAAGRDQRVKLATGWERRSSVLYRGASPDQYDAQLYVAVFSHPDRVATPDDARALGNAELAESRAARECKDHPAGALTVYGCTTTLASPRGAQPGFEGYVVWGARVLFVRHIAEVTTADADGPEVEAIAVFTSVAPHR